MNINRLIATPYFSKDFLDKFDNRILIVNISPEKMEYGDLCLILNQHIKGISVANFNNKTSFDISSEEFFSRVNAETLRLACIRSIVGVLMDISYPSKKYWADYKGVSYDEFLNLWLEIRPEDTDLYKDYEKGKCLDILINHAKKLRTMHELDMFENFIKGGGD